MSRTKWSSESIRNGKDSKRGCLQNSLYFATLAVCTVGFLITTYGTMSKYFSDSKLTSMYYQVLWPHLNLKTKLILYLLISVQRRATPTPLCLLLPVELQKPSHQPDTFKERLLGEHNGSQFDFAGFLHIWRRKFAL